MSEQSRSVVAVRYRALRRQISLLSKRSFDLVASGLGLLLLLPLFCALAIVIKLDTPGPVFYRGRRSARGGGEFAILKFRTMYETQESYAGPKVTGCHDARVTRLGRWLRKTKLNELPQLWNVFKGEMSLVGPRPEDPEITATWADDVRKEVLSVRPGITSPASVLYRNEESMLNTAEVMETYFGAILPSKLRLDQLYVRHRSFLMDIDVLLWTALVFLPRLDAFKPAEKLLFWGPISQFIRRYVSWYVIDAVISFIAISAAGVIWRSIEPLNLGLGNAVLVSIGFSALFSVISSFGGTQRVVWSKAPGEEGISLVLSSLTATAAALVVNNFVIPRRLLLHPGLILLASSLALVGFVTIRFRRRIFRGIRDQITFLAPNSFSARERVLIIGGGAAGQFAAWMLGQSSNFARSLNLVGIIDDDLFLQGSRIYGKSVVGRREDIPALVKKYDVGILVFSIHNISKRERIDLLEICGSTGAKLILFPDFLGILHQSLASRENPVQPMSEPEQSPTALKSGVPVSQMQDWLKTLSDQAERGDVEAIKLQIGEIQNHLDQTGNPQAVTEAILEESLKNDE